MQTLRHSQAHLSLVPLCVSVLPNHLQAELTDTQSRLARSAQEVERLKGELRSANATGERLKRNWKVLGLGVAMSWLRSRRVRCFPASCRSMAAWPTQLPTLLLQSSH